MLSHLIRAPNGRGEVIHIGGGELDHVFDPLRIDDDGANGQIIERGGIAPKHGLDHCDLARRDEGGIDPCADPGGDIADSGPRHRLADAESQQDRERTDERGQAHAELSETERSRSSHRP
ncbi:hypothetical protein JXA47_05395 [Candidatus Sumerlaeota bacterium]|nr:hypothetical protein [Candidatus Sumerlaeota bacterium]